MSLGCGPSGEARSGEGSEGFRSIYVGFRQVPVPGRGSGAARWKVHSISSSGSGGESGEVLGAVRPPFETTLLSRIMVIHGKSWYSIQITQILNATSSRTGGH